MNSNNVAFQSHEKIVEDEPKPEDDVEMADGAVVESQSEKKSDVEPTEDVQEPTGSIGSIPFSSSELSSLFIRMEDFVYALTKVLTIYGNLLT